MKIRTYTQLEAILRTAFDVEGNSIKTVATMASINLNSGTAFNVAFYFQIVEECFESFQQVVDICRLSPCVLLDSQETSDVVRTHILHIVDSQSFEMIYKEDNLPPVVPQCLL